MAFARRIRVLEIVLAPGQIKQYCLPPTTRGLIEITVHAVFLPNEADPPDDGKGIPPGVFNIPDPEDQEIMPFEGPPPPAGGGSSNDPELLAQARQRASRTRTDNDGPEGPGPGMDSNPTLDVALELRCFRKRINRSDTGVLIEEHGGQTNGFNVYFKRNPDAFQTIRRRFRVIVSYPSVLPQEERRIPLTFLKHGFDRNWNLPQGGVQYLKALQLQGKKLRYWLEPFFAAMYRLSAEGSYDLPFDIDLALSYTISLSLPRVESRSPILAEASVDSQTDMALEGSAFYFGLTVNMVCPDGRTIEIDGAPDAELPAEFWFNLRFYPVASDSGTLTYIPRVTSSLTVDVPVLQGYVNDRIKDALKKVQDWLFDVQRNAADGTYLFDKHLKPWLIGHYELNGLYYDAATDELVLQHVGNPISPPLVVATEPSVFDGRWRNLTNPKPTLMFNTAGEHWLPPEVIGGDGQPVHLPPVVDPGDLGKIDHIVVLMQENRSFDHMLGYLSRDAGHSEVEGLLPGDNDRDWNDCDKLAWRDLGTRFSSRRISDTSWPPEVEGPCHSHDCTMQQMAGGMKYFVANFAELVDMNRDPALSRADAQRVMDYHGHGSLPVYDLLVDNFAICDHWFGSFIGGTLPNRHVSFSGDLNRTPEGIPEEANSALGTYSPTERKTFFDHLTTRGVGWKLFEHGYSFLRLYRNFTFDITNLRAFDEFERLAQLGNLPPVTYIEPDYIEAPRGNDDHAPSDLAEGQRLIAKIVRALIRSPQWEKTLFVITYDEHGGFYDHVVPPTEIAVKGPDGSVEMRPIPPLANGISQLGPRVPAFVISPYTLGPMPDPDAPTHDGAGPLKLDVSKKVYEHASIPATILRRFCGPRPPVLSARVSAANDLRDLLPLPGDQPRKADQFTDLLAALDAIADAPARPLAPARPNRLVGLMPGSHEEFEDFGGFMTVAAALTGMNG